MKNLNIECPKCNHNFSIDDSIRRQIEDKARLELEGQKKAIEVKVQKEISKKNEIKIRELEEQLTESSKMVQDSINEQLALKKKIREVHTKEQTLNLEIEKKVQEQLEQYKNYYVKDYAEKHKYELLQKEKIIKQMKDKADELQQKLQQGSQQIQGEVVEEDFEEILKIKFPLDNISPIPKGMNGADIVHTVIDQNLNECGSILWEFKNTKTYSKNWIPKLKEDQRKIEANMAILVTNVLPKDSPDIDFVDGIYLVKYYLAVPLCMAIRNGLKELNRTKLINNNKDEKMSIMYKYLTGTSFNQKFRSILNAYKVQKEQLESEKKSLSRIWAKREKQLEIILDSASSMFGDIEGIIGSEIPVVPELLLTEAEETLHQ